MYKLTASTEGGGLCLGVTGTEFWGQSFKGGGGGGGGGTD